MNFVHESWTPEFPFVGVSSRAVASASLATMEHGPQLHVILLPGVAIAALVGWLAYRVTRRLKTRRRSDSDPATDRTRHASDGSRKP